MDFINNLYNEKERQELNSVLKWSEPKPALKEYKTESIIALSGFIFFAAIASIIAAPIVAIFNIPSPIYFAFIPVFWLIYWVEYHNLIQFVRRFQLKKSNNKIMLSKSRIIAACLISCLNISVVFLGSIELMKSEKKTTENSVRSQFSKDSLQIITDYQNEKNRIEKAIEHTKKSYTYKGQLSYKGMNLISELEIDLKELRKNKDVSMQKIEVSNFDTQTKKESEIDNYFWLRLVISFIIEILLIGCAYFIANYRMTVYFENINNFIEKQPKNINKDVPFEIINEKPAPDDDKKKVWQG